MTSTIEGSSSFLLDRALPIVISGGLRERFWQKVNQSQGPLFCWEWTAARTSFGYGVILSGGQNSPTLYAHRVAWTLANGAIPKGMCVCHRCDNPMCVNPAHLFLGTYQENVADMVRKGRHGGKPVPMIGEKNPGAKITDMEVLEIRAASETGLSSTEISRGYDIDPSQIRRIIRRKAWAHIDVPPASSLVRVAS